MRRAARPGSCAVPPYTTTLSHKSACRVASQRAMASLHAPRVLIPQEPAELPFLGGAIVASQESFARVCTREEYNEGEGGLTEMLRPLIRRAL